MKRFPSVLVGFLLPFLANAADFQSVGSGSWSESNNWNAAAIPDPFGTDNVVILNQTIDYDAGSTSGYLATSNHNSITVAGGSLTQSSLSAPIVIGDGAGAVPQGSLQIQSSGLLDTGAAFGLVVGGSLSGADVGNGTATIADGTLRIGVGASASGGGMGVGLDGSVGVLAIGDGIGSAGSALLDLTAAGQAASAQLGIGTSAFSATGGNGTAFINSDGKLIQGTATIFVGEAGGTGSLTVQAGGQLVSAGGNIHIGDYRSATGTLVSSGTLAGIGEFVVGLATANGTATIQAGSLQAQSVYVGRDDGSGTLNITSGTLTGTDRVIIGEGGGSGVINLQGGVIQTAFIEASDGPAVFNIRGGTLRANRAEPQFLRGFTGTGSHSAIDFTQSTLTIDSHGFDIGIGQEEMLTGNALTKIGSGTLTILATQDYEFLQVNAGSVILGSALDDGTIQVHSSAQIVFTADQSLTDLEIGPNATATLSSATANLPTPIQPVPEPSSGVMILLGAAIIAGKRTFFHEHEYTG